MGHQWVTHNFNTGKSRYSKRPPRGASIIGSGGSGSPHDTYQVLSTDNDGPAVSEADIGNVIARMDAEGIDFRTKDAPIMSQAQLDRLMP